MRVARDAEDGRGGTRTSVLAQHLELDCDVVHGAVALDRRLVDHLHRVDLRVEVAAHLEDLAVAPFPSSRSSSKSPKQSVCGSSASPSAAAPASTRLTSS